MIDAVGARNLELVNNLSNAQSGHSLFGILNHTSTQMGDVSPIEARLDVVEEMSKNEEMFYGVKKALSSFEDLDRVISMIIKKPVKSQALNTNNHINQVLLLKSCLESVKPIVVALGTPKSALLLGIKEVLENSIIGIFQEYISKSIEEDAGYQKSALGMRHQRCYAIKSGVCGMLDVARQIYREAVNDIYDLVAGYCEETNMNIKVQFSERSGFYMSMASDSVTKNELPTYFINVVQRKKQLHFTTIELLQLNYRVSESLSEIYRHSDSYVTEILNDIRNSIHILYNISEAVALLDMCVAFTYLCTVADYVRPEFSDTLAIKSGRHPIKERVSCSEFVPNDIFASDTTNFQIVTGPNMSGKSTYLRTIALLCIMAHIGSFVPAEYACFRPTDYLFTRLPVDDSAECGLSSFMVEMRDIAYLLQNVTDSSLVIMDELGRATSTCEALAITTAVCEELIEMKAFVYFATHLHELTYTLDAFPNVVKLQLMVDLDGSSNQCAMRFHYVVQDGRTNPVSYGNLQLKGCGNDWFATGDRSTSLRTFKRASLPSGSAHTLVIKSFNSIVEQVVEKLRVLQSASMPDHILRENIEALKHDYMRQLNTLDQE
ncbi:unnamed protein product [Umbelopsis vinacea]